MLVPMGSSDGLRDGRSAASCPQCGQEAIDPTKKPPQGLLQIRVTRCPDQCALAQTFFLVKYISPVNRIRNTNTCSPSRLRASMCGSAVHIRNVVTSCAYCATVAGEPSSKVTWPSDSGFGILLAWPGEYLL